MRFILLIFLGLLLSLSSIAQQDTTETDFDMPQLDTTRVNRFGIHLGGGIQQMRMQESSLTDSFHSWQSDLKSMYKIGCIFNHALGKRASFQTGFSVSNAFYLFQFMDGQTARKDTNGYSQIDIPIDFSFELFHSIFVRCGIQYHVDITKQLLKEKRLFDLRTNSLSTSLAIGPRFHLGDKYFQTDAYIQYGFTNILLQNNNRYAEGLKSINPYQIGLRIAFY